MRGSKLPSHAHLHAIQTHSSDSKPPSSAAGRRQHALHIQAATTDWIALVGGTPRSLTLALMAGRQGPGMGASAAGPPPVSGMVVRRCVAGTPSALNSMQPSAQRVRLAVAAGA